MSLPAPYYEADGIRIFCGDNTKILPHLGEFDLLLTDPPYGIGKEWVGGFGRGWGKSDSEKRDRNSWDAVAPDGETISTAISKCKEAIIWGGNYFNLPPSRCWLVWNKPERGFTLAEAELAWTNRDALVRVWDGPRHLQNRMHPTQKPDDLISWCLSHAPEAKTVLDPWMGSGTTLVAAKLRGLTAVGVEINEDYCKIAVERLRQRILITP